MILGQDLDIDTKFNWKSIITPDEFGGPDAVTVKLTHKPTGLIATGNGRSELAAREAALISLNAKYFEQFPPWGQQIVLKVYVEGETSEEDIFKAVEDVGYRLDSDFIVARTFIQHEEPDRS